jgi:hypothetical protein
MTNTFGSCNAQETSMLGCLEPRGPRERRALVEKGLETHDKRSASFTRAKPDLVIAAAVFDVALTVPARDPAALLITNRCLSAASGSTVSNWYASQIALQEW